MPHWLSMSSLMAVTLLVGSGEALDFSCDPCIDRTQVAVGCVHHGSLDDPFWAGVANAIRQGARDMNINLKYDPISERQAEPFVEQVMTQQIIEYCAPSMVNSTDDPVHGLFVSLPSEAILTAIETYCLANKIPTVTFNAGLDLASSNKLPFIGQNETQAGFQAGVEISSYNTAIDTYCCTNNAPGVNVLTQRCTGFNAGVQSSGRNANVAEVNVDRLNCTSFISSIEAACSPSDGVSWNTVGLYLSGQGDHLCGMEFAKAKSGVVVGASDVTSMLYEGMKDPNTTILFGIDQQAYLQGYHPSSLLTLQVTNNQRLQNLLFEAGPSFVKTPPTQTEQLCQDNNFAVCIAPDSPTSTTTGTTTGVVDTITNTSGSTLLRFHGVVAGITLTLSLLL